MSLIAYETARHEDLRDEVNKIIQEDNDVILQMFLNQSVAASDTTHKWADKKLKGYKDTLQADITPSATTVTIAYGSTKFSIDSTVNNKQYIKIDDEYMLVTAGSGTNSLTVTRGQLGTSATVHSAGADVFFEEMSEEGADNERDDSENASKIYNVSQVFRRELKLSGTSQAVNVVGGDAKMANQAQERLKQLNQKLRVAFLNSNVRYVDGDESLRKMAGLPYYITNVKDKSGQAVSTAMFDAVIEELLDNGVDPNDLVMLTPTQQVKRINALKIARVVGGGMQDSSNTIRNNVDQYEFSDALVKIVRAPEMPKDRIIIGCRKKAKIVPVINRAFKIEPIAKRGDSVEALIVGEYTAEVFNGADAWIMLKNLVV